MNTLSALWLLQTRKLKLREWKRPQRGAGHERAEVRPDLNHSGLYPVTWKNAKQSSAGRQAGSLAKCYFLFLNEIPSNSVCIKASEYWEQCALSQSSVILKLTPNLLFLKEKSWQS